jgi:hypothetical protein
LRHAFRQWLHPGNFDAGGRQLAKLGRFTSGILKQRG